METDKNGLFGEKYLLVAKVDNVKHISSLLKAVNFKDVSIFILLINISYSYIQ